MTLPTQLHLRAEAPQFSQLTALSCLSNCFTVRLGQKIPRSSTYYLDWSPNFNNYLCSNSLVPVGLRTVSQTVESHRGLPSSCLVPLWFPHSSCLLSQRCGTMEGIQRPSVEMENNVFAWCLTDVPAVPSKI